MKHDPDLYARIDEAMGAAMMAGVPARLRPTPDNFPIARATINERAQVAVAMLKGGSTAEQAAAALGVTPHTIRAYWRSHERAPA